MSVRIFSRLFSSYTRYGTNLSTFKSSLALENIYPSSSSSSIAKTPTIPQNGEATFSGYIPMDKVKISHCRSSGPGGQNVNMVNTKVEIRFHLDSADWIPGSIRSIMKYKVRSLITKDGSIFVTSDRTRYQHMNVADALEKLREIIRSCEPTVAAQPSPETIDLIRKRTEKVARERLRQKKERSFVKTNRGASSGNF